MRRIGFTLFSLSLMGKAKAQHRQGMEHNGNIHIGQIIQAQLKADQRSVGWLSRQIPCSRNHVYKLFKRPSLDADLLLRISIVMQFNFFQYYTSSFLQGIQERVGEDPPLSF